MKNISTKAIAIASALGMLAINGIGAFNASAASLTDVSDTITSSVPSAAANHTLSFTTSTGVAEGQTIALTFDGAGQGFNLTGIDAADMDVADDGSDLTLAADCSGSEKMSVGVNTTTDVVTLTVCAGDGGAIAANSVVGIEIGTNATGGSDQIENPATAGSYNVGIAGTMADSGSTVVAVVDAVTVSAEIGGQFTFTVNGVNSGATAANGDTDCNGVATTGVTTTSTTIPFGTMTANQDKCASHNLTVSTNASNGYSVGAYLTGNLASAGGDEISVFEDNTAPTPKSWVAPGSNDVTGTPATYGAFGITSDDETLASGDTFGTAQYTGASKTSTSPTQVMYHTGPADGTTAGSGSANVGYKLEVSELQAAGNYQTTLVYLATPIF